MIVIGSGPKCFCSGFDLKMWAENPLNSLISLMMTQKVLARILELGIPSMAVFNGHAIAGGVFIGLACDRIIMKNDPKLQICCNELTFGKAIPYAYVRFVKDTTSARLGRTLLIGTKLTPEEAKRLDLIQDLYDNDKDLENKIHQFAKERAIIGEHRDNY